MTDTSTLAPPAVAEVDGEHFSRWLEALAALPDRELAITLSCLQGEAEHRAEADPKTGPEDPWAELVRRPDIKLLWWRFDGEPTAEVRAANPYGDATVYMDTRLSWRRTTEALAHELLHLERGLAEWTPAERDAEEAEVRRITAERMAGYCHRERFIVPAFDLAAGLAGAGVAS